MPPTEQSEKRPAVPPRKMAEIFGMPAEQRISLIENQAYGLHFTIQMLLDMFDWQDSIGVDVAAAGANAAVMPEEVQVAAAPEETAAEDAVEGEQPEEGQWFLPYGEEDDETEETEETPASEEATAGVPAGPQELLNSERRIAFLIDNCYRLIKHDMALFLENSKHLLDMVFAAGNGLNGEPQKRNILEMQHPKQVVDMGDWVLESLEALSPHLASMRGSKNKEISKEFRKLRKKWNKQWGNSVSPYRRVSGYSEQSVRVWKVGQGE